MGLRRKSKRADLVEDITVLARLPRGKTTSGVFTRGQLVELKDFLTQCLEIIIKLRSSSTNSEALNVNNGNAGSPEAI